MENNEAGWRRNTAQLSALNMAMQDFASRVLRRALRGHPINNDALAEIRAGTIRYLKNLEMTGLAVEDQANIIRQAIELFDHVTNTAIRQATELDDD